MKFVSGTSMRSWDSRAKDQATKRPEVSRTLLNVFKHLQEHVEFGK